MPRIECRAINEDMIKQVSTALSDELAEACGIARGTFSYAMISGEVIVDGEWVPAKPYIRVWWFTRPAETQKIAADIISKHFQKAGLEAVTVYFESIDRERSYKYG